LGRGLRSRGLKEEYVRRKLGELPTMKLNSAQVAQFAKHADARAAQGRRIPEPELEVSVEYLEEVPTALRRSDVMPIVRSVDGPRLEAVPIIIVGKDDLAWFEFEADAHAILAMIDGESTVADIVTSIAVAPERAMELLRDLELQRVIAL
jgi:hypothetical protein